MYPHKVFNARPTTDFAKAGLFNILNNYFYFENLKVLDLFSGTGGIGLEFVSRGSSNVEMVEMDQKNFKFIAGALKTLEINNVKLIRNDALKYLSFCKPGYDIIFADPPYEMDGIVVIPDLIFERKLLNDEGWFIFEHSGNYNFSDHRFFKEVRVYGNVHFSIFINR